MRPRPGAARMYPETDMPSNSITDEFVKKFAVICLSQQKRKLLA